MLKRQNGLDSKDCGASNQEALTFMTVMNWEFDLSRMQKIKRAARTARTLELKNNYAENRKLWEKK